MCVLSSLQPLVETVLTPGRIQYDITINALRCSHKVSDNLPILTKLEFSRQILIKIPRTKISRKSV